MKEFKGTKGEWIKNGLNGVHKPNGDCIAVTFYTDEKSKIECEYNAQLIAAAPNLLFACMQAKECYETKGQLLSFDVSIIIRAVELALGNNEQ